MPEFEQETEFKQLACPGCGRTVLHAIHRLVEYIGREQAATQEDVICSVCEPSRFEVLAIEHGLDRVAS